MPVDSRYSAFSERLGRRIFHIPDLKVNLEEVLDGIIIIRKRWINLLVTLWIVGPDNTVECSIHLRDKKRPEKERRALEIASHRGVQDDALLEKIVARIHDILKSPWQSVALIGKFTTPDISFREITRDLIKIAFKDSRDAPEFMDSIQEIMKHNIPGYLGPARKAAKRLGVRDFDKWHTAFSKSLTAARILKA